MKLGRAVGDAAGRVPAVAPLVAWARTTLRRRRNRRRAAGRTHAAPRPPLPGGGAATPEEYGRWIMATEPVPAALRLQGPSAERFADKPLISVVLPVYKVPLAMLSRAVESLQAQTYPHWEACVAFADVGNDAAVRFLDDRSRADPRIRVTFLPRNGGIAANSNAALALARGEFVALLDHDDELAATALFRMVEAINACPEADFLYSDKDSIDAPGTLRQNALFKPAWSPEMLFSVNYLTHLNLMRRSLVTDVGGFRSETDGAQDWDVFLRVCERARRVVRVPGVLYHWRIHPASTATGIAAKPYALAGQLRAVADHVARRGLPARVVPHDDSGFRVCWQPGLAARLHVVVDATEGRPEHLRRLIHAVAAEAAATAAEATLTVIAGNDAATEAELAEACAAGGLPRTSLRLRACRPAERTAAVREAVAGGGRADEVLVFLSARVADSTAGGLAELVGWTAGHPEIGFASGLVLDADGSVAEAGLVVDRFGNGSPLFRGSPMRHSGWLGGPLWYRNCTAASPWMVAVNAAAYAAVGGLDGGLPWPQAFIRLCREIGRVGKRGVVVPHVRATLSAGPLPAVPAFDVSLGEDPYFHPAFSSVVPLALAAPAAAIAPAPQSARSRKRRPFWRRRPAPVLDRYAADALALANANGCTLEDLSRPQQHPDRVGNGPGAGWCNWYLPPFDNAFYGGVMTILRFADFMRRTRGIRQRFVICGAADGDLIRRRIVAAFPGLAEAPVTVLESTEAIAAIPPSDYSVATLWTTAYVLLKVHNTGLKFYFLQDFEPLFYPAGSTSAQAELTYQFGFHAIANTRTLREIYENDYGGIATHFTPQIDPTVFHGTPLRAAEGPRRLFFYGRPGHPRNGFELAAVALRLLKDTVGDRVEIVTAGASWEPRAYGLDGVVTNLGLLDYRATGDLYRSCHVGFVMMMTKHPSYLPLEFMACGGLLVSNVNRANAWLLRDGVNCLLAPASPPAIAARLAEAVDRFDDTLEVRRTGHECIHRHHDSWDRAFADVLTFIDDMATAGRRRAA